MHISIDETRYELTTSELPISSGQEAVLDELVNVITEGHNTVSKITLINQFGFKSALPLESRINHLVERGRLRVA
jgi:hypothetical protein